MSISNNAYGRPRNAMTSIHSPFAFYERVRGKQLGDAMPPDLFIMDAHDTRIPTWYVVGRAPLHNGEFVLCLENLQSDLMPRTPALAPLTIAVLVTQERILRTKGPYQRLLFPDLYEMAVRLKEPHSSIVACICPFTIPVKCKGCGTDMLVLSYPPEFFEHRLCVVCTQKHKKELAHKHKAQRTIA